MHGARNLAITRVLLPSLIMVAGWGGCRPSQGPADAQRLFDEAEQLQQEYEREASLAAIDRYRDAAAIWSRTEDAASAARATQRMGDTYEQLGAFHEAQQAYVEALSLSSESNDLLLQSAVASDVGSALALSGESEEALKQCHAALELAQRLKATAALAEAHNCLGEVQYHHGAVGDALNSYETAASFWREAGDSEGIAETLLLLGSTHSELNEFAVASEELNEALSLWDELGHKHGRALNLVAQGNLSLRQSEYEVALEKFFEAEKTLEIVGDRFWQGVSLTGVARVYRHLGRDDDALLYLTRAASAYEEAGIELATLDALMTLGRTYLDLGDPENAVPRFQRALTISEESGNRPFQAHALRYLGLAELTLERPNEALRYLERSLTLQEAEAEREPQLGARTLANLGRSHELLGQRDAATSYFRRSLRISQESGYRVGAAMAYYGLARVARVDNLGFARESIEAALRIAESLRTEVESQELRASYFASIHDYHELNIDILMSLHGEQPTQGLAATAFEASERARARSLLESLSEAGVDLRTGVDPDTLAEEQAIKDELEQIDRQLLGLGGESPSEEEASALVASRRDLEIRYDRVQARIRGQSPQYAALTQPQPLTLEQIQDEVLDDHSVLLEYALGEKRSFLWVVSKDEYTSFELPPRQEVELAARRVYDLLTARIRRARIGDSDGRDADDSRSVDELDRQYWRDAARLSEMLIGPARGSIAGKRLVVVPAGALQYIPFSALPVPGSDDLSAREAGEPPEPLIVDHEVIHLPSASAVAVLRRETRDRALPAGTVAVFADPVFESDDPRLPPGDQRTPTTEARPESAKAAARAPESSWGLREIFFRDAIGSLQRLASTRNEARAIIAAAPEGTTLERIGADANRATAMSPELGEYRIVHLATHGVFNDENPSLSGIVLSLFDERGRARDGFLRLHDIYSLDLPVELVVLSACNTALGEQVKGEGMVGMVRGFMNAGAKRVIASLWKVDDDATSELMSHFYRELLVAGKSPGAALREAQLAMWRQDRWRPPFFWAAFVLQGEWA